MKTKNTRVSLKKLVKNKSNKINKLVSKPVIKTKKTGGNHKSKRARSNKKGGLRPFRLWRRSRPTPNIKNLGVYARNSGLQFEFVDNAIKYLKSNQYKKEIEQDKSYGTERYHFRSIDIPGYTKTHKLIQYIPPIIHNGITHVNTFEDKYDIYTKNSFTEGPKHLLVFKKFGSPFFFGSEDINDFLAMDYV